MLIFNTTIERITEYENAEVDSQEIAMAIQRGSDAVSIYEVP